MVEPVKTPDSVVQSWVGNKARRATIAVKEGSGYKLINATDFKEGAHEKYDKLLPNHNINETAEEAAYQVDEKGRVELAAIRAKNDAEIALAAADAAEARADAMRKQADAQIIQATEANKLARQAIAEQDALVTGEEPPPPPVKKRGRPKGQ